MINAAGREIPEIAGMQVAPYQGPWINVPPHARGTKTVDAPPSDKILKSIEEAIDAVGLKDGMTISFHHHFRNGDYVMKLVVDSIAAKGIRDLTLSASS